MDGFHFDALTRSLTTAGSRRRALIGLVVGTLGVFGPWAEDTAAKNCKKIKNKKKRKKCLAKTTPGVTAPPGCVPTCAASTPCGPDGCGGACRSCEAPETCQSGQCLCTPNCIGKTCGNDGCGGSCGLCTGGTCSVTGDCSCDGGKEFCRGACVDVCRFGSVRNREDPACSCCWPQGQTIDDDCLNTIGSGANPCCSGQCFSSGGVWRCDGRSDGAPCTFDEQCRSGQCHFSGFCTGGVGG